MSSAGSVLEHPSRCQISCWMVLVALTLFGWIQQVQVQTASALTWRKVSLLWVGILFCSLSRSSALDERRGYRCIGCKEDVAAGRSLLIGLGNGAQVLLKISLSIHPAGKVCTELDLATRGTRHFFDLSLRQ